jgi:hypothetical protein
MPPPPHPSRRAPIAGLVLALLVLAAGVAHASSSPSRTSTGRPVYAGAARPDLEVTIARAVTGAHELEVANLTAWYAWAATLPPPLPTSSPTTVASSTTATSGTVGAAASSPAGYPCGGDLPPCWVLDRESGYNDGDDFTYDIHAYNPSGCGRRGCYGKWQCDPRSCDGTGTEAEQDAEARRLWDGGRGCSHWGACR